MMLMFMFTKHDAIIPIYKPKQRAQPNKGIDVVGTYLIKNERLKAGAAHAAAPSIK
jgi:hypothetical protein